MIHSSLLQAFAHGVVHVACALFGRSVPCFQRGVDVGHTVLAEIDSVEVERGIGIKGVGVRVEPGARRVRRVGVHLASGAIQ